MAEESCSTIPSNDKVIEEVIKGMDDCVVIKSEENACMNSDSKAESNYVGDDNSNLSNCNGASDINIESQSHENEHLKTSLPGEESDECGKNSNSVCDEDDSIDELALKDAEESYTNEEKEQRRMDAESSKAKGNDSFKIGNYKESIKSYTLGLRTCPLAFPKERAIMYSNRAAAKMKLELKDGAIEDCSKAIELDALYLKARYRRAQLYEETDKLDEALADYQEILKLDPLHREALYATKRLPEKIHERNEKMKTEMFAKLKDLGNMILRPFNLSTENFHVNQDPSTGGYSINFKPNTS